MSLPTPQSHIIALFRNQIWHSLDNNLLQTALFTAERLHAYDPKGPDSVHLLALCYFRDSQLKTAEVITRPWTRHVGCAYVFAQCCLELGGGRQKEGITALEKIRPLWTTTSAWNKHTDTERKVLPDAAAINCLLGKLYQSDGKTKQAIDCYVQSVKLNPFLWEAFEGLLETGVKLRTNNIFKQTPEMLSSIMGTTNNVHFALEEHLGSTNNDSRRAAEAAHNDPFSFTSATFVSSRPEVGLFNRLNESSSNATSWTEIETPTAQSSRDHDSVMVGANIGERQIKPPGAPARKTRAATADITSKKGITSRSFKEIANETKRPATTQVADGGMVATRRSTRLLNTKLTSKFVSGGSASERATAGIKEREAKKIKTVNSRSKSAQGIVGEKPAKGRGAEMEADLNMIDSKPLTQSVHRINDKQQDAQVFMLDLFRRLASGLFALSRYNCQEALQIFNGLNPAQRETPWVLSKIGRAYYEMANYLEAEKIFMKLRQIDPTRTRDMEVYSTLLWHLRKDVELSFLAHELVEQDRLSPQAWCAIGNSFSLQRDHEQALKCFKRATQLDPELAYAFTLQGHEHVSSEEYDKALVAYRNAMSADPRHYNAWYGLGKVYEKTGKYDMAEKHFKQAHLINPTNAVLVCCVGMVLEKTKNFRAALVQYNQACELAPRSALSRFKKARTLMALGNYHAALQELLILKDLAPDEANVHYTLGRLYKNMKDRPNAIKHFTTALHLDPKANHLIKEALEALEDGDMDEDTEVNRMIEHQ